MLFAILFITFLSFQTEALSAEAELSWDVQREIDKQAKAYVGHCAQNTTVTIGTRYGFWPMLFPEENFKKRKFRKTSTKITKTLAWVAEERNKVASYLDTLTAEEADYEIHIGLYREILKDKITLGISTADDTEALQKLMDKESDFLMWRSNVNLEDLDKINDYVCALKETIKGPKRLLQALTHFYDKQFTAATSKEGAIAFVLQNVEAPHADFFAFNRPAVEKYMTDTYYPDA